MEGLSKKVSSTAIIASLGGLLFGYDTAVISGAIDALSDYFQLNAVGTGWATSSALVGCVIGSLFSGILSSALGRKRTLIIAAACYTSSAIGSALADTLTIFVLLRILGGIGIGFSAVVPAYLSEISPPKQRGMLLSLYQLSITFGILVIYLVNFQIAHLARHNFYLIGDAWLSEHGWRWMIGSEVVPAVLFLLLLLRIPESPRWLFMKGREDDACAVLQRLGYTNIELVSSEITASIYEDAGPRNLSIRESRALPTLLLVIALAVLQQAVGINVIIYYAHRISSLIWLDASPFTTTILIGIVNFLATFIAVFKVDQWGRKKLLFFGSLMVCFCQLVLGFGIYNSQTGAWMFAFILLYIISFACSVGPLIWIIIAELAPNMLRARFTAIAVFALWSGNIIVSFTFPLLNESSWLLHYFHGGFPFFLYGSCALILALLAWRKLPETKGCSLEEIEQIVCRASDIKASIS